MTDVIKGGKGKQGGGYVFPLLIFFMCPLVKEWVQRGEKNNTDGFICCGNLN